MGAEAERWREVDVKRALAAEVQEAGDALLAALEAAETEKGHLTNVATEYQDALEARDRRIAELEGLEQSVLRGAIGRAAELAARIAELEARLAAGRELDDRLHDRIAKLEAGLRRMTNPHGPADGTWYRQVARDLLAAETFREIVSTDARREVRP